MHSFILAVFLGFCIFCVGLVQLVALQISAAGFAGVDFVEFIVKANGKISRSSNWNSKLMWRSCGAQNFVFV